MMEYTGALAPVVMPFVGTGLSKDFAYVAILWSWVLVMNLTVALVGNHIMRTLKAREADLRRSMVFDGLTGLYNRTHFFRLFQSEVARAKRYRRRVSVLVIDTDDIGEYNAQFGHSAGDLLVRVVADVVAHSVRRGDDTNPYEVDVAARLGGGTFAIVAPEVETPEAMVAAERLRETVQAVATPRPGSGIKRPTTVSIGVAAYPADGIDVGAVVGAAYEALDRAKAAGRNRVVQAGP
jgi:diguanylate cyclase (GGDEF)-like protein